MLYQCVVDFKLVLEYFKVIMSFPTVVLILAGTVLWRFRGEIRSLINRMRTFEVVGTKAEFGSVTEKLVEAAVSASTELKEGEIDALPPGADKEAKIVELEAQKENLRQRLIAALEKSPLQLAETAPVESREDPKMAYLARQLQYLRIKHACKDLILEWLEKANARVTLNDEGLQVMMSKKNKQPISVLYGLCMAREKQLVGEYGEALFKSDIRKAVFELAPENPLETPLTKDV